MLKDENIFLIYTLLTNGDENNISNKIFNNITCKTYSFHEDSKKSVISNLIDIFKRQIIETIKNEVNNNKKIEQEIISEKKEKIKQEAQKKYEAAIANHNEEKITLIFYD